MKKISTVAVMLACIALLASCKNNKKETLNEESKSELQQKVEEYAYFDLTTDLSKLTESERKLLPIFFEIGQIMDDLFWEQTFGDKSLMDTISDPWMKDYAMINYGPWDRLDGEKPFVPGYGERPPMANYYPQDITKAEYDAYDDPLKSSHYTVLRRDENGKLITVGYYEAYKEKLDRVCELLDQAIEIADNPTMKKYLVERKKSLQTNDYYPSDMAWMDLRDSNIDFVFGPIENYDDALNSVKTSWEAFVLVKDVEASTKLDKFVQMLPALQRELPCDPAHKMYVPGTTCDMNLYDVVFYGGDCNAAGKTIAINLPNDDNVQAKKGSRRF
ncbi:MAG: Zn-dependent hydrolase, partial [Bacteroidales bacterium]|nr:Zn-dependent hydrolase [Bacteroidales bacterium]